jgi:hypothetical protein
MYTLREWQQKSKDVNNLIVQASVTNGSDSWQPFSIGMQYSYMDNYHKGDKIQIGNHDKIVLCCISTSTDMRRRPTGKNRQSIVETLINNNINNISLNASDYFDTLPEYKFVISPEGNGIDCHRHYESLIAGCIPVIEYNYMTEEKYAGCPILYTHDYSEITEEYLLQKYNEMIDETYDFSKLFLSYYNDETQQCIQKCGNYWTYKFTNKFFYNY